MTIVVVRDGVLAVESRISTDGLVCGSAIKWRYVDMALGGGVVAGAGPLGKLTLALDAISKYGEEADLDHNVDYGFLWLNNELEVKEWGAGSWYALEADYYAIGADTKVAMGALEHGATAKEAVEICCKLIPSGCGGEIYTFDLTK